jgi:hypothetical protein
VSENERDDLRIKTEGLVPDPRPSTRCRRPYWSTLRSGSN